LKRDYAENTTGQYLRCIGMLAEMIKADGITIEDLDEAQAVALIAKTDWSQNRGTYPAFIVRTSSSGPSAVSVSITFCWVRISLSSRLQTRWPHSTVSI
jgi:hypothetical protein